MVSAGTFGGLLYLAVSTGLTLKLSLIECFLFGALISATDPVSVLGEVPGFTRFVYKPISWLTLCSSVKLSSRIWA